jgi:hypothetical protein
MSSARIDGGVDTDDRRSTAARGDGHAIPSGEGATPSGEGAMPSGEGAMPSGEGTTPSGEPAVWLDFVAANGARVRSPARLGPDGDGAGDVRVRNAVLGGRYTMIQRRLAGRDAERPQARAALEREVSAALQLVRVAGGSGPFPDLVGYDVDVGEPFVLYRTPRGRPLAELARVLPLTQWRSVGACLVSALRLYELAGLAHADLMPNSVHWDGNDIQLGPPWSAASIGSPRRPSGVPPWASPEVREGRGAVDIRDDLWSAAQLLYYLLSGQPGAANGPPADLALKPVLEPVLRDLFKPLAADRPSTLDVLRAMSWPERAAQGGPGLDPLAEGRRAFEEARDRKRGIRDPSYQPPGPPAGPGSAADDDEPMPADQPVGRRRGWLGRG